MQHGSTGVGILQAHCLPAPRSELQNVRHVRGHVTRELILGVVEELLQRLLHFLLHLLLPRSLLRTCSRCCWKLDMNSVIGFSR